jgi:hypothetical protein
MVVKSSDAGWCDSHNGWEASEKAAWKSWKSILHDLQCSMRLTTFICSSCYPRFLFETIFLPAWHLATLCFEQHPNGFRCCNQARERADEIVSFMINVFPLWVSTEASSSFEQWIFMKHCRVFVSSGIKMCFGGKFDAGNGVFRAMLR